MKALMAMSAGVTLATLAFAAPAVSSDAEAIKQAATLDLGDATEGEIAAGERECFRVATGGRPVAILLEPNEDGPKRTPLFNRAARVYDGDGQKLLEVEEMADNESRLQVRSKARTVFICVAGAYDGWIGEYRLRVVTGSR